MLFWALERFRAYLPRAVRRWIAIRMNETAFREDSRPPLLMDCSDLSPGIE